MPAEDNEDLNALRREIARLEKDLALEASTRARLHAMNLRLVAALQKMDDLVGDMDALVQEAHQAPRSRQGQLIDGLKVLIRQWRSLKRDLRQEMAGLEGSEQDLALEASTSARLHAMNLRLVSVLQEMDDLVGDALLYEAHRDLRSRLGRLIDSIKALILKWWSLKRDRRQEMAGLAGSVHDGEQ